MKLILSPAKSLDYESKLPTTKTSEGCFLAEAERLNKLLKKKCDAIVVNKIDKNNQVFGSDLNKVSFITKKTTLNFKKTTKINVAKKMIQLIDKLQKVKI